MWRVKRQGKVNPLLIAILPPIVCLAAVMVYSAFRWAVPAALTVERTDRVEALEVLGGINPLQQNGLLISQRQSLRTGGSSRLIFTRPAGDGYFTLVSGTISASYLKSKIEMDKMLHLKIDRQDLRVEQDGEEVASVVMFPRKETTPLVVDDPTIDPNNPAIANLYVSPTLLNNPPGAATGTKFVSDNGMTVDCTATMGSSGTISLAPVNQLEFKIDGGSTAWVQMGRSVRVQATAVGTEDLEVGILIPSDADANERFDVFLLGDKVATVRSQ